MKKSMSRLILLIVAAIMFVISVGCTSETNVPQESSDKTSVMPSATAGVTDDKAAMTETKVTNQSGERMPGQMLETTLESGDDAAITALVKAALLENPSTSDLDANVETNDGVVTLSGRVKDAAEMEVVANFVKNLQGVKNVVNNMTIE
ncbi:BON domain-containing protein [Desulfonatronum thiodismutans]|uniref:BON domain-containing protein n=1 Tax=Desulfonatronum thiodismutans TaxID=159290 RepID=UPI00068DF97E|nr:BON domain-containing protein [Desulfonatronum thiodismutans]